MRLSQRSILLACLLVGVMTAAAASVKIPSSPAAAMNDEKFQKAVQELPEDERQLVAQYMLRATLGAAFAGTSTAPTGITLAEAVAAQKAFVAQQSEKEKAGEALADALKSAVHLKDIKVEKATESGYRGDTVKVSVTVKNTSGRPIAGVKVFVETNDIFGDRLGSYGLKSDTTIQPQGETTLTGHYDGSKVLKADQSKVSVKAEPLHIVFEDRSELKSSRTVMGF